MHYILLCVLTNFQLIHISKKNDKSKKEEFLEILQKHSIPLSFPLNHIILKQYSKNTIRLFFHSNLATSQKNNAFDNSLNTLTMLFTPDIIHLHFNGIRTKLPFSPSSRHLLQTNYTHSFDLIKTITPYFIFIFIDTCKLPGWVHLSVSFPVQQDKPYP